jgi:isochorismate hydrolase
VAVVKRKEHPERPEEMRDGTWALLQRCWAPKARRRPKMEDIVQRLEMMKDSEYSIIPVTSLAEHRESFSDSDSSGNDFS